LKKARLIALATARFPHLSCSNHPHLPCARSENEEFAKHLDFTHIEDEDEFRRFAAEAIDDLLNVHPSIVGSTGLGAVGIAPLRERIKTGNKYVIIYDGTTGDGKSLIAIGLQCFFGNFDGPGRCSGFGGTIKSIQRNGYFFRFVIYYTEDLKESVVGRDGMFQVVGEIQQYADERGRSRLTRNAGSMPTYYLRGEWVITAEDVPSSEASTLSRAIIVPVPGGGDIERGTRIIANRSRYSAITLRYVQWLTSKSNEELQDQFNTNKAFFLHGVEAETASIRVAQNFAQNALGFQTLFEFLESAKVITAKQRTEAVDAHMKGLLKLRQRTLRGVNKAKASTQFLQRLGELIETEAVRIAGTPEARWDTESSTQRTPIVGFERDDEPDFLYVIPGKALEAVTRAYPNHRIGHSTGAIARQLHQEGHLVAKRSDDGDPRYTQSKRIPGGNSVWVWAIKRAALDMLPLGVPDTIEKAMAFLEKQRDAGAPGDATYKRIEAALAAVREFSDALKAAETELNIKATHLGLEERLKEVNTAAADPLRVEITALFLTAREATHAALGHRPKGREA
jgi:hypothetical protein